MRTRRWAVLTAATILVCHLSMAVISCSSIECPVQNTVAVNYDIRNGAGSLDSLKDTLWVLTRRRNGTDTLLLNRLVGKTSFSLNVSYSQPEDTLLFVVRDTLNVWSIDTVWLKKENIPHFESVDCNAHYFHKLTAVRSSHQAIDSMTIANPNVNYDPSYTHIHIYFKSRR